MFLKSQEDQRHQSTKTRVTCFLQKHRPKQLDEACIHPYELLDPLPTEFNISSCVNTLFFCKRYLNFAQTFIIIAECKDKGKNQTTIAKIHLNSIDDKVCLIREYIHLKYKLNHTKNEIITNNYNYIIRFQSIL